MGWRNQHDFKISSGIFLLSLFLFSGCIIQTSPEDFNYEPVTGQESDTVKIENDGPAYFITWNTRYNFIDVNDAIITKTKQRRSGVEDIKNLTYSDVKKNPNTLVDQRNVEILSNLSKKTSRDAEKEKLEVRKIESKVDDTKEVWLWGVDQDSSGNSVDYYYSDTAICKYAGKHCVVWYVANPGVDITEADCIKLGEKFDTIYELETKLVGSNIYETTPYCDVITPQDKIELVFTDLWKDKADSSTIIGYQSTLDAVIQKYYEEEVNKKHIYNAKWDGHSNESQLIYIDTYIFKQYPDTVYSTLTHEFNHLLNYCQKSLWKGMGIDTWYTEMLAMLTEDAFQKYLGIEDIDSSKARLLTYCTPTGYTSTPFSDFQITGNIENVTYSYASTYALGAYLVRNFGGLKLMHEIATNEATGLESIDVALEKAGYSYDYDVESLKNFNYVFFNEPYFLINIEANKNEDITTINKAGQKAYYTLNRTWTDETYPELSFDAISLVGSYKYKDANGKEQEYFYQPEYMDPQYTWKGYIFNCAYTIWDLGSNLSTVKVEVQDRFTREGFWQIIYPQQ